MFVLKNNKTLNFWKFFKVLDFSKALIRFLKVSHHISQNCMSPYLISFTSLTVSLLQYSGKIKYGEMWYIEMWSGKMRYEEMWNREMWSALKIKICFESSNKNYLSQFQVKFYLNQSSSTKICLIQVKHYLNLTQVIFITWF
jgi:hypothetical protein